MPVPQEQPEPSLPVAGRSAAVVEVTAANFQQEVVERSMVTPVLLDFWADWCGPCKTLGPLLEKLAQEFAGGFVLGKVDADREKDLANAFQVQGIPFCVLVDGGRPVDGFQGALRETEVRRFLQRNAIGPAKAAPTAEVAVDPASPKSRLERALAAAGAGDAAAARAAIAGFPEDDEGIEQVRRLEDALQFLEAALASTGPAAEVALARGRALWREGDVDAAMESILAAVAADKSFRQGLPRKAMLLCFLVLGDDDERVDSFRRRLATLLY